MIQISEYLSTKIVQSKIKATDETIKRIVKDELDRLGHDADLNHIDVSEVTNMDSLFSCYDNDFLGPKYKNLNPDISSLDVSNVIDTRFMFYECENFNQDISQWNVSKVIDMHFMFCECKTFNQDLSQWDVSNVRNWDSMFTDCPIKEEFKPKFN